MVQLPRRPTRVQRLIAAGAATLLAPWRGGWRRTSAQLLALLLGFYAAGNITSYVLVVFPGGRPGMVLALVLLLELIVRLRTATLGARVSGQPLPFAWVLLDSARLGLVYAVVLEAFKVGT